VGKSGVDEFGSEYGPVASPCEYSNEPSSSIKGGNFLTSWVTVSFSTRTLTMQSVGYLLREQSLYHI